jgi:hypothetical protein
MVEQLLHFHKALFNTIESDAALSEAAFPPRVERSHERPRVVGRRNREVK